MAIDAYSIGNIPFYGCLPMAITNFGGDLQVCTIPEYCGGQIGLAFNNLGLLEINGFGTTPIINNWGASIPTENIFMKTAMQTAQNIATGQATQKVKTVTSSINITKQKLDAMLLAGTYSTDQVDKINDLIDRLNTQEAAIVELGEDAETLTPSETISKANEIENKVREIINDAAAIGHPEGTSST